MRVPEQEREMEKQLTADGLRAVGLDYGAKTVGVAAADALGVTAQGIEIIRRKSEKKLRRTLAEIEQIVRERGAGVVVLGLPYTLRGETSERTYRTLKFREMLMRRISCPVVLWDERLTTVAADRTMKDTSVRKEERRDYVDEIAAMLILQGYLDCVRSGQKVPAVDADGMVRDYEERHPEAAQNG